MFWSLTKHEIKMPGYWHVYLHVYGPRWSQGPQKTFKKMQSISSHLDRTSFVKKGFIIWPLAKFFLRDTVSSPEQAAHLGSQLQHRIQFILPAYKASHIISTDK